MEENTEMKDTSVETTVMDETTNVGETTDVGETTNVGETANACESTDPEITVETKTKKQLKREKKQLKREKKREKKLARKQAGKDRKRRWKEEKKRRRAELKEHYKDAPFLIKFLRLYFIKPFIISTLAGLALVFVLLFGFMIYYGCLYLYHNSLYENRYEPVEDVQLLYDQSPIDEEGAKRIDAMAPSGADDTWTFCVYIVGADLEDYDENDLSETTQIKIHEEREARNTEKKQRKYDLVNQYEEDLNSNSLDLPDFLYYPNKPVEYSYTLTEDSVVTTDPGAASTDIYEIIDNDLNDNISVVIQTGGATRWENSMVNPNRTQRFLYHGGDFEEVANLPLERSTDPDTLSDFIRFCKKEYAADHMVLILWDHGGGPFGYGVDSIFGGETMSIAEIRQALQTSCKADIDNPEFDIIAFDACLMSTIEVTHALYGYAEYYVLAEETEPGDGWDYSFLQTLSDNPTMSAAAVGREIVDKYTDCYMTQNVNLKNMMNFDLAMALLDAEKCEEVYDAYGELAKKQLTDSADDMSVLAGIGRAAMNSTHFAGDAYNYYNQVDLANYVDNLVEDYPEECSKISNLIDEAVIYNRQNGSLSDAEGLAVYIPGYMDCFDSLYLFLKYEYLVCEDENVRNLYFYKIAGCLTDDMKEELKKYTDKEPKNLDPSIFHAFEKTEPKIDQDGFSFQVSDELQSMIQGYDFCIYQYDEDSYTMTYYGSDELAYLDGDGNLRADFDGTWIFLDGVPLSVEVASSTNSGVDYVSRVDYNGQPAYLLFSYDRDSEEFAIKEVRLIPEEESNDNYLISSNNSQKLQNGDKITPIYQTVNYAYNTESEEEGKTVKINPFTKITEEKLDSGLYLGMITIYDQRGDSYFSAIIDHKISGKKVKERTVDENFYGRGY